MDRRTFLCAGTAFAAGMALTPGAGAAPAPADGREVALPAPDTQGGRPVMECMALRRSNHAPGTVDLTEQQLANVLWAACGISDRESGKLVVPTGMNRRQIAVYAVLKDGIWQYLPEKHAIRRVVMGDRRADLDGSACVLLYVAPVAERYSPMHVGSMYQNVSLCCTSMGISQCVKNPARAEKLAPELPLQQGWEIFITQGLSQ